METKKRQKRKVGVAGGFINQMMGNNATQPEVGKGATILMYSDRHAYEVIEVSEGGSECVIRNMNCIYTGSGYGDEQYRYESNPEGSTYRLRWNPKKGKWQKVFKVVHFIKAMANRMRNEYGWKWVDQLDIPKDKLWNEYHSLNLIEGITKEYTEYYDVSIIFGVMEEYRDPSF